MIKEFIHTIIHVLPLMIAGAGVTIIEIHALNCGIDGKALAASFTSLGVIAGFVFKVIKDRHAPRSRRKGDQIAS
jgi:hypothetical protein